MAPTLHARISSLLADVPHPHKTALINILTGATSVSSSGWPYISEASFRTFLREVPHLFRDGETLLRWLHKIEQRIDGARGISEDEAVSMQLSIRVMRNMVFSAAVCAPSDLWIARHLLSCHFALGLPEFFRSGGRAEVEELAARHRLNANHLGWDLAFLYTRGYLGYRDRKYRMARNPQAADVLQHTGTLRDDYLRDMVEPIAAVLSGKSSAEDRALVSGFLTYSNCKHRREGWYASHFQLETGYRLLPVMLSLHVLNVRKGTAAGTPLVELVAALPEEVKTFLESAGIIRPDTRITQLGSRVIDRGAGPFGIIHAYVPYMRVLREKLSGTDSDKTWVQRGKNISASQDANRKTFETANNALDSFSADHDFRYGVFIEHALGLGEATRQRLQRNGESELQYFGADLEDAAIERASELQRKEILPQNMVFIPRADIANPNLVIDAVRKSGFGTEDAVMFVGNGFHEIRAQTNEKIIEVFRRYCDAGIITVFTEESALSDRDLRATAWNTYHAGFRYVHELSGQGLRPAAGTDRVGRHSWKICAALGGYAVLPKYSTHTRTIYPFPRKGNYNPPISMTYFCVPADRSLSLGWYPQQWSCSRKKG